MMMTRNEMKRDYNKEKYMSVQVFLEKELVLKFKETAKSFNVTYAEVLRHYMKDFIESGEKIVVTTLTGNKVTHKLMDYTKKVKTDKEREKEYKEAMIKHRCESFVKRAEKIKTESELYKLFHGDYMSLSKLKEISGYLGIEMADSKNRSDTMYQVYNYFLEKL